VNLKSVILSRRLAAIINQASLKSTDRTRALITVTLTIYAFDTQAFIADAVSFHGCSTSERFSLIACKPWTCIKRGRTSDTGAKHVRSEDSHNQHPTMVSRFTYDTNISSATSTRKHLTHTLCPRIIKVVRSIAYICPHKIRRSYMHSKSSAKHVFNFHVSCTPTLSANV